jgi:hypothetical protein
MSLDGNTFSFIPYTLDGINDAGLSTGYVPYTGANQDTDLNSQAIRTTYTPTLTNDLTNKGYVDSAISSNTLLPLNNVWTGTNTFNNTLTANDPVSVNDTFTVANAANASLSNLVRTELNNVLAGYTPASITVGSGFGTITNAGGVYESTSTGPGSYASLYLGNVVVGDKYSISLSLKSIDVNNNTAIFVYEAPAPNHLSGGIQLLSFNIPPNTTTFTVFSGTFIPSTYTNLILLVSTQIITGINTVYWNAFSLTGMGSVVKNLITPTTALDGANKGYVDTQDALRVPYIGATANLQLGSYNIIANTAQFTNITSATPSLALGVDGSGNLRSFAVAVNLLPLNNTWTGTNTFNNTVTMGDTYTTNVNSAFASNQTPIANATNFVTGGTDFTGAMPVSVLTKPSYYNLTGAGNFGMSIGLDLGYTGGSFTAGASTTITGSWTANTVSSRIATITFDVTAHIGKSLRCVWEGVTPLVFTTSPPPFFTVVNGATTVYSSPQPISGTNTYAWNFTPTVGTTTITYTVQSTGTPSLPAFSWTGFSIKQISPSRLAYKTGAKYTATFTNMIASQLMYLSVYQYTAAGGTPLAISDISNIPVTTSAQTITITFSVNIFPTNLGTVIFFFQPTSANQYVRFDSSTITRADMTVSGNVQSALTVNNQIISANPSGNSGNGVIVNMSSVNGAFGSLEVYDNVNLTSANKLPLALQAYGGSVGIATTSPLATFQVYGTANICGGTNFANLNGYMASGSLTIGDTVRNYGGGNLWNSNTAGLLLECLNNTEIAVHDAGNRVASLMYYTNANSFIMGRDMGWGVSNVETRGDLFINAGVGGRLVKNGSDPNYYATFNGGNSSNAPFLEFIAFGMRRMYIGNSTPNDNYIWAENGSYIRIGTNGSTRMSFAPIGDIFFENGFREVITVGLNGYGQYRMVQGSYGVMWRQDGSDTYLLVTNPGDQYGVWNSLRPFRINNASGRVTMENNLTVKGGDYIFESVPQNSSPYSQPVLFDGNTFRRSQCVCKQIYNSNSVAWGGGVNMTYAFYNYNRAVSVVLTGRYSGYWTSSTTNQLGVRVYNQNSGVFFYYYFNTFTNNTFNHVTVPLNCFIGNTGEGWHDLYIFNSSGYATDGNDQLQICALTFCVEAY